MIHVFGNSHVGIFSGDENCLCQDGHNALGIRTHTLGPVIAYNFTEHHLPAVLYKIQEHNIVNEKIIMVVGEVDCRWHLPLQCERQNRSVDDIVSECVKRYGRGLSELKKRGIDVTAWGTHPTTNYGHSEKIDQPIYGDMSHRNSVCVAWNNYLREFCEDNDINFLSIYSHLVDEENNTKMEYYQDYCHLNNKVLPFIYEEMAGLL